MATVNRPTNVKQKEEDVNQKLQLYGIYSGKSSHSLRPCREPEHWQSRSWDSQLHSQGQACVLTCYFALAFANGKVPSVSSSETLGSAFFRY